MDKIRLSDLGCYKKADDTVRNSRLISVDRGFDLDRLPPGEIRTEMKNFLMSKGGVLSLWSMKNMIYPYHLLADFLFATGQRLDTLQTGDEETVVKEMKRWLYAMGKKPVHIQKSRGKEAVKESEGIRLLRQFLNFVKPREEGFTKKSDIWHIKDLPFGVRMNPVKPVDTLNFSFISSENMKAEFKAVIYAHLQTKALGTVQEEMSAFKAFITFFERKDVDIHSFNEITRETVESYLIHIHTDKTGRKDYSKTLFHLRSVITSAARVVDDCFCPDDLFLFDDFGRTPPRPFVCYSDQEIIRFNAGLKHCDSQVARAVMAMEILGGRISDILTLRQDCLFRDNGRLMIRIDQVKSNTYFKPVDKATVLLLQAAIKYTTETYGKREYIFVSPTNPERPMGYGMVRGQIEAMIRQENLVDDSGRPFAIHFHYFRKNYGKRLAELGYDDLTIARMLGHKSVSSVRVYRKIGSQQLADETSVTRDKIDQLIGKNTDGGQGDEKK